MAPKSRAVTAKSLQALLTRIGAPSSGTKAVLQDRFRHELNQSRLFNRHPKWEKSRPTDQKLRIMSIDMGIKNLAFCEAEISYPVKDSLDATMDVLRWEKINLVPTKDDIPSPVVESEETTENTRDDDVDPYSLNVLSKTAYGLVKNTILAKSPDIILIEKQRWRSGGGSAVQQWTLRVNTLEGMLWAILQTIYSERLVAQDKKAKRGSEKEKLYEVFGVDPKRVGMYWLGEQDVERGALAEASSPAKPRPAADNRIEQNGDDTPTPKKKPSRSKAEKSAKISLLRKWLSASPASTASRSSTNTPTLSFTISPHAQATQYALCSPKKSPRRRKDDDAADEIGPTEMKKLDDITDCFLQAAAWVSWESNRLQLCGVVEEKKKSEGEGLDEGVMGEMVRVMERS
ncbi:hypothetical protein CFE70_007008 [Pyrenophora teres f. teres 0-1]|uniref:SAP domain-containing protein n=2 Tax=Pyrenophora teres f. teres TaxID=97479 RepID=E3RUH1_PYRTT|nr:hypothetical protein PTT_12734 [Pyrenophora teres f. teres 0-1]KAE8822306.1 hypothetical protein HRS9139_10327 [Pyrenophora teres f. teres]KAE8835094.1 hypothetical protein PTNB85_06427 [Pyrenophora teres f. teres]KAE8843432.1 hypothetical protein HRS9122_04535 [Pyrenophora teres f. teres]KAE8856782.1 hypothetical protein PTNB73_09504 [Pyrenophora teres f. teres]